MANGQLDTVMRYLRQVVGTPQNAGLTDSQLLERVVASHDQAAFEVLIWRHGPMVTSVCRRVLRHTQDAEDAFQATFLTLARKAGSLRRRGSLAGWLYRVAFRIALRAKAASAKRSAQEKQGVDLSEIEAAMGGTDAMAQRELRAVLDEELDRLPEKYRTPLVLCYLQGKSHAQAAKELGRPLGSMSRHVAKARQLLCQRLTRRGVLFPAGLLGMVLAHEKAAALSVTSVQSAVQGSMVFALGHTVAPAKVSAKAIALAQAALHAMSLVRLKLTVACVLGLGITAATVGAVSHRALTAEQSTVEREEEAKPKPPDRQAVQPETQVSSKPIYVYFTLYSNCIARLSPRQDLLEVRLDVDLQELPLRDALQRVFGQAKQQYAIEGNVPEDKRLTLRGKGLLFSQVLDELTSQTGTVWSQEIKDKGDEAVIRIGRDRSSMTIHLPATPDLLKQIESLKRARPSPEPTAEQVRRMSLGEVATDGRGQNLLGRRGIPCLTVP